MITQEEFLKLLSNRAIQIEGFLGDYLSNETRGEEIARPERLLKAIRHGVLNGGKRMRPFLVLEVASMFGSNDQKAMHAAAGLECLHCYSLVHDDLPAMDDDDYRRGQPTIHKAFDEATAILAGDAMLTLSFELTVSEAGGIDAQTRCLLAAALARDAGMAGMVGGQTLDLAFENSDVSEDIISRIHAMKTGALIRYACTAGVLIAGGSAKDVVSMQKYGEIIGLAFQLADDLLDVTSDSETMGKATGKDSEAGKRTLVEIYGVDWARARLDELIGQAEEILVPYGERANVLRAAAHFVAKREF
ncbi:MAG: polyprenyl synthetase family protein [Pseudomonadota bacterium]